MYSMKKILAAIILCSIISLVGCATTTDSVPIVPTTEYEKGGLILQVPDRWTVEIDVPEYLGFSEYKNEDMVSALSVWIKDEDFYYYVDRQTEYLNSLDYIENLKAEEYQIGDLEAVEFDYYNNSIDNDARCREVCLNYSKNLIIVGFYSEDSMQHLYFDEVLRNISIAD